MGLFAILNLLPTQILCIENRTADACRVGHQKKKRIIADSVASRDFNIYSSE